MKFRVLGPLEIHTRNGVWTPSQPRVRTVLAMLLVNRNQVVSLEHLIDELWADEPRKSANTTVQTYIYQLRKHFQQHGLEMADHQILLSRPPGYLLRVAPGDLDADVFAQLAAGARAELNSSRPHAAAGMLRQALSMWAGPALSNVPTGSGLASEAVQLNEQRIRALELRIQADMEIGLHRELIGELRSLVVAHPLHEWFHGQLIRALSRSGRRSEALEAYHRLRVTLRENLGLDPAAEAQELHQEVLTSNRSQPTPPGFPPASFATV
jgi:SARP family transcriptional regulator, regulator of embCAB operon